MRKNFVTPMKMYRLRRIYLVTLTSGMVLFLNGVQARLELPWEKDKEKTPHGETGGGNSSSTMPTAGDPDAPPRDSNSSPVSLGPDLFSGGDFTEGASVEGDGDLVRFESENGGTPNRAWRLVGPDGMSIMKALASTPGSGEIVVKFRLLVPSDTREDPNLDGIRVRARLMDRYESSAVNGEVVEPSGQWETIEFSFSDTGSGPYTLGLEVLGHTGPVYFDDIEARMKTDGTPQDSTILGGLGSPIMAAAGGAQSLAHWFEALPWFQKLSRSMPRGVSLVVFADEEVNSEGFFQVEVRETHSADSGYDPNVSPMVGIFYVTPDRQTVKWSNPVSGEIESLDGFLSDRDIR